MFEQLSLFQALKGKKSSGFTKKQKVKAPDDATIKLNTIQFLNSEVEIVRRPYQRSLSVIVKPNGRLRVTCARLTPKRLLFDFLKEHEEWIKKTLDDQQSLRSKYPPKKYTQSEAFLFLGGFVHLNFSPTTAKRIAVSVSGDQLNVFIPSTQWSEDYTQKSHPELREEIQKFYKQSGKKLLGGRMKLLSEKMQLYPFKVSFRSQKTRWGSCSSQGNITLNWRLIAAPIETQDYVIIHELAHLRHQDHSKKFWKLVEAHCPNYKEHNRWLREHQFEFDFLSQVSELHE